MKITIRQSYEMTQKVVQKCLISEDNDPVQKSYVAMQTISDFKFELLNTTLLH